LVVHLTPTEYATLREKFKTTTYRIFSDYIRGLLSGEPIIKKYRNQSLDEFELTAIQIKRELENIRRDFGNALQHLKSLSSWPPAKEALEYLIAAETDLRKKQAAIQSTLINIYEKCSQERNPSQK
jgi:hypothetical protein